MSTDTIRERTERERLVVNVEGTRDIGPAESEGLLRECLVLTHKRLDAAIWRGIERLQALGPGNDDELGDSLGAGELIHVLVPAVVSKRALVVPRFKTYFDEAFQRRREGKPSSARSEGTAIDLEQGSEGLAWERQLSLIDDLLARIGPKTTVMAQAIGRNVARAAAQDQQELVERRRSRDSAAGADVLPAQSSYRFDESDCRCGAWIGCDGVAERGARDQRGDRRCAGARRIRRPGAGTGSRRLVHFLGEGGQAPVLARLAWRAAQRKRLLFSHRGGATAFVHTPESLAETFRTGRATLAIEAVPLFERAMARLIDQRSQTMESEVAASA